MIEVAGSFMILHFSFLIDQNIIGFDRSVDANLISIYRLTIPFNGGNDSYIQ